MILKNSYVISPIIPAKLTYQYADKWNKKFTEKLTSKPKSWISNNGKKTDTSILRENRRIDRTLYLGL